MKSNEIELYVHIPFCIRKCIYCDFNSFPPEGDLQERYVKALCREVTETAGLISEEQPKVRSIFVGGGTPSLLKPAQLDKILDCIRTHFSVNENAEISMEANPGTLTYDKLLAFRTSGINRLSIGLQSTEDRLLKTLGRIHSFRDFLNNYEAARKAGFDNINIDLMSGIPGQRLEDYAESLKKVLDLDPDHLSIYSLIVEEGTPLSENTDLLARIPGEEEDRAMYHLTGRMLSEKGFRRYEISNYARPGKECIHNLGYWSDVPYMGFGLGASSYQKTKEGAFRYSNYSSIQDYMKEPCLPFEQRPGYEKLTEKDQLEETMFLGLRKIEGISIEDFRDKFGRTIEQVYGEVIRKYIQSGHLICSNGRLRLTEKGIDVSDYLFADFML